jgi:hypothetical protein
MIQLVDISPPGQAKVQRDQVPMDVIHVTAEMAPVAKVGGLGDVVQGLAKASAERGHNVQVLTPRLRFCPSAATAADFRETILQLICAKYFFDALLRGLRNGLHAACRSAASLI